MVVWTGKSKVIIIIFFLQYPWATDTIYKYARIKSLDPPFRSRRCCCFFVSTARRNQVKTIIRPEASPRERDRGRDELRCPYYSNKACFASLDTAIPFFPIYTHVCVNFFRKNFNLVFINHTALSWFFNVLGYSFLFPLLARIGSFSCNIMQCRWREQISPVTTTTMGLEIIRLAHRTERPETTGGYRVRRYRVPMYWY